MPKHISIAYIDLLTVLVAVFFAFVMVMSLDDAKGSVKDVSQFLFTAEWSKESKSDVDIWMQGPDGITSYQNKQQGSMVLDVDDKGDIPVDVKRREVISVKAIVPGRYVINVMLFSMHEPAVKTQVSFTKLVPFGILIDRELVLDQTGQEVTIASFTVTPDGKVVDVDQTTQVSLAKAVK